MNDQEITKLIDKMQEVFPSRNEMDSQFEQINSRFEKVDAQFVTMSSQIKEVSFRLNTIEKDLKSVVRIYNLDEEMTAVYDRISRIEQKLDIQPGGN